MIICIHKKDTLQIMVTNKQQSPNLILYGPLSLLSDIRNKTSFSIIFKCFVQDLS